MAILPIVRLGHPALRGVARGLSSGELGAPPFQTLLDDMVETMREYNGVGLAAPQVHLSLRLAVLEVENHPRYPEMPSVPLTYLINPTVTVTDPAPADQSLILEWEGCLSIPELRGLVPRFRQLRVTALGRHGEPLDFVADDFHARVIQHETDHLKGEVYLDRMPDMKSLSHLPEWQRFVIEPAARAARKS